MYPMYLKSEMLLNYPQHHWNLMYLMYLKLPMRLMLLQHLKNRWYLMYLMYQNSETPLKFLRFR
jgi:hypothetical protein